MEEDTYKITRTYMNGHKELIETGLTLEEAQAHCSDPETSYKTCTTAEAIKRTEIHGPWFDVYHKE